MSTVESPGSPDAASPAFKPHRLVLGLFAALIGSAPIAAAAPPPRPAAGQDFLRYCDSLESGNKRFLRDGSRDLTGNVDGTAVYTRASIAAEIPMSGEASRALRLEQQKSLYRDGERELLATLHVGEGGEYQLVLWQAQGENCRALAALCSWEGLDNVETIESFRFRDASFVHILATVDR